jgi:hypothetical protein
MTHTSPLTIVRFTVEEGTLHALLSGNPERRRALRDVEWGSRDTETGDVLVTPPLRAEEAVALRALFAGAEVGVSEVDVTGEYAFAYTTAPEVYDGHGTLSFTLSPGAQEGERLVAIRHQHLTWQASRYASGLHRFRPVEPHPPPEAAGGAPAEPASADAAAPPSVIGVGTVVHFCGRSRRFVVVAVEVVGEEPRLSMVALSGAVRGCYPTAVPVADVERDSDQAVAFTGAAATTLHRKFDEAMRGTTQAALPMAS